MPSKIEVKKCNYSHCKHTSKEILINEEDYIEENNRYYHVDCKHEKDTRAEIIDFWYRNIDADVVFNQLSKILDRMIYKENIDPDFILWALKKKHEFLHYPPGLVYLIKDKKLKKEFEINKKMKQMMKERKDAVIKNDEPSFTFNINDSKKKLGDIFGGM